MYELVVKKFENRLIKIQDEVSDGLIYPLAKLETEKLLEDANKIKSFLLENGINESSMQELNVIINQVKQYLEDLIDLDEIRHL